MSPPSPCALADRRILVTGASVDSDIGRGIASELARNGARLVLAGRRVEALEATKALLPAAEQHLVAPYDLTELDGIPAWVRQIAESGGPLGGIVHSASHQGYSPLSKIGAAEFDRYFSINVGAAILLARALRQRGVAAPGASIVYIGSVAGLRGQKGRTLYAASKAALVAVTRSVALELADLGIRANCVAPAIVKGAQAKKHFSMLSAEQNAALAAAHPLGIGMPGDVAHAVSFLLSDAARWITGTVLPVDGGFMAQ
ncbi:oxidoreductase [Aliidongia dinghuensis]|uniref:Oxidoreductase n=1 Tax=Aliidongia dinghuensis TaxID=1867774 RepID=A0A8J2YUR8_9PROT|nr:SDR family oxidoreductase [Aliidongia dinghuensis]GGF24016.1 oxidoreductase [Aliidongia dinghuensis]